jgi:hypothetical protein
MELLQYPFLMQGGEASPSRDSPNVLPYGRCEVSENAPYPTILTAVELNTILKDFDCAPDVGGNRTDLHGANFRNADIGRRTPRCGELQGATLSDVTNLTQKQIDSVNIDANTILPAGMRRP